ncbi:MAG: hypothetical protein N2572_07415 [Syntrophales bacterium]|nr:hypothetical protein [Syntrophales bacterium]
MADVEVKIFDIMACDVYWDFEDSDFKTKETHKFLVAFYPTPGVATPELIENLTAYGPNGYQASFSNEKFTVHNKNGWIYDARIPNYWYMVNLPKGFLEEGEYTIEVKLKDGRVVKKSRYQKRAPSEALVNSYVKYREDIYASFSPSKAKPLPMGTSLANIRVSWTPLKSLGGIDAFYVFRLAEASNSREFDAHNLVWFDNIYLQRLRTGDVTAGLNRGEVVVETELKPSTSYGYFVEITDANVAGEANICIFQPHQFFVTP